MTPPTRWRSRRSAPEAVSGLDRPRRRRGNLDGSAQGQGGDEGHRDDEGSDQEDPDEDPPGLIGRPPFEGLDDQAVEHMSLRVFNRKVDALTQREAAGLLKELSNLKRRVA